MALEGFETAQANQVRIPRDGPGCLGLMRNSVDSARPRLHLTQAPAAPLEPWSRQLAAPVGQESRGTNAFAPHSVHQALENWRMVVSLAV